MGDEQRKHLLALRQAYQERLYVLEKQAAIFGLRTPPHIPVEIEEIKLKIDSIDQLLSPEPMSAVTSLFVRLRRWFSGKREPSEIVKRYRSQLSEDWQRTRNLQVKTKKVHRVVPELQAFIADLCNTLDFVVIQDSYHTHHNKFVACHVKAPTLYLNLPPEFPIVLMLEEHLTSDRIKQLVEQLSDMLAMLDGSTDFGLVFVPDLQPRMQAMVNELIRPAMKSDLIVLGESFLDDITTAISPQTVLLSAILREVDLTRVSPFMAGGADLVDNMFFGREGELKNIAESITKTSVAITCGRRMGKTTLLNRLARVVLPARGHPCYFLNCQPVHDYDELLTEMATTWQRSDLPFDPAQPNSFAQIAAALTGPAGEPPIFLLDEVDELLQYDGQNQQRLFKQLRALSLDGRAHFIMTGERSVQAHLHDANSPLFNFFGLNILLSFLDLPSMKKLVIEPLADMQIELRDPQPMLDTIFEATSGHPYLVQRLCQGLVQAISRQGIRIIGPEHIELVLNDRTYQQDYFETVLGQSPLLARVITKLVGPEGATLKEIQQRLNQHGLKPALREIRDTLDVLDLYSVLVRKSERYYFVATAFPEMLRRAYGDDLETN